MAIQKLPTDFEDDILNTAINEKRKYRMETNPDGTISLEDVTEYEVVGDYYGKEQINTANDTINKLIDEAEKIEKSMSFVLLKEGIISFNNNISVINDSRIKQSSLADVYFTSETYNTAENASISVETYNGYIELTAGREPEGEIKATITIRTV